MMKKQRYLYSVLLSTFLLNAETYAEFKASMHKDYNTFTTQNHKEYSDFRTQMDKDFAKFLGRKWKKYGSKIKPVYRRPKPRVIPIPPQRVKPIEDNTPKVHILPMTPEPEITPRLPRMSRIQKGYRSVDVNFFNQNLRFNYNEKLTYPLSTFNNSSIANYWNHQSSYEIQKLLEEIKSYKQALNLSDWHLYLLINQFSKTITSDENNAKLLSWFLLIKLGYDVKVGYKENNIYMLVGLAQTIAGVPYSRIGSRHYFNFDKVRGVRTYAQSFGQNRLLNLDDNRVPYLRQNIKTRTLSFNDGFKAYHIPVSYNQNLIDLYDQYPRLRWRYYFSQNISPLTKEGLFPKLGAIMKNMSELEAVNFLLHLTQNSFKYKTDGQQFGEERSLFFEESLNYPANDCEDRSIFFAKLVRGLLGLEVVALYYPNHLATAVAFKSKLKGDSVKYEGRGYTICDPTYINANVGMTMSKFKGMKPIKIIPVL